MGIVNFASLSQYAPDQNTEFTSSPLSIRPNHKGVAFRLIGHANTFNSKIQIPPVTVDPLQRPWLRVLPMPTMTTSSRSKVINVGNEDIDPALMIPGNIIQFGFKFAAASGVTANSRFIGWRLPSTTVVATTAILTPLTTPTINPNEWRWIDFRFEIRDNLSTLVQVFVNKDLVHQFEAAAGTFWSVGAGTIANSMFTGPNQNNGFYLNDFLTVIDHVDDEVKTGMIGPVTVKSLPVATVRANGNWVPPAGKTILEALNTGRLGYTANIPQNQLIHSDPSGGTLTAMFKYPENEDRPILALQEIFTGQRPASQSSTLQYQRIISGRLSGPKITVETGNDYNAFDIVAPILFPLPGATALTPDDIESRGVAFNSVRKIAEV